MKEKIRHQMSVLMLSLIALFIGAIVGLVALITVVIINWVSSNNFSPLNGFLEGSSVTFITLMTILLIERYFHFKKISTSSTEP